MPDESRCGTCVFFDEWVDPLVGLCRRNPPVRLRGTPEDYSAWPEVASGDWCGEYRRNVVTIPSIVVTLHAVPGEDAKSLAARARDAITGTIDRELGRWRKKKGEDDDRHE